MAARLKSLAAVLSAGFLGSALAASDTTKHAWTDSAVSPALHSAGHAHTVTYSPERNAIPPGAVITRVRADRRYTGDAMVQTSLCWNGAARCVDIVGPSLMTGAFDGLDAGRPFHLVHRVVDWRGSRPPVHVQGNVTVWFSLPPAPPAQ